MQNKFAATTRLTNYACVQTSKCGVRDKGPERTMRDMRVCRFMANYGEWNLVPR